MKEKGIIITKESGEREAFSEAKLRRSLERAQATPDLIDIVVEEVKGGLYDGMSTSDIYTRAFSLIRKKHRPTAARYHLKRALMELGPTGHPFEKFIGELLKAQGLQVEVGKTVEGVCVFHEIDVSALQDDRHIMIECKFHNQPGVKSDVKVALYIQARFEDVAKKWKQEPSHGQKFHEAWLVTNTKLTSDAARYASCVGMKAIGWGYPMEGSLEYLIEQYNLHPLTCLTSLNQNQKQLLLNRGIILCRDIIKDKNMLGLVGLNGAKVEQVINEAKELCHII
ncbi:MAG: ATPase [Candidatus Doudnabacteria bacterium RIFCSPHIGHO2_01_FULL_49_9]|uniref:ATPase n=1 Tax=Candidatus Doudnabacteria bacterium RIFCSPHIGHO2_01_FULL_49_9 TaxID=1817827 RepID=A0A1F5NZA2_9BACT|nr:MAG: ATPase [Candidatus Doudnabacteria bacterium RIFCSPHIGHO2_01_FULL_49_9]